MQKIEAKEFFSFANICAFAVIAAICAFPFRNDIKNLFILKNDYANTAIAPGIITHKWSGGSGKHKLRNYKYEFIIEGEKISGKFDARMSFSFTRTYERGEPIDILYNKRINFFCPKEAVKGEIAEYINLILFAAFVLWLLFVIIKNKIRE